MKAKLILKISEDELLDLSLIINDKKVYNLFEWVVLDDDKESYEDCLENTINESTLIINSIPGLKLIIDQSVIEFIEGEEEEIGKFVQRLVIEI